MSYEPTIWKTGDIVSSEKLNKLENGLASEESRAKSEEVRLEQLFTTPTQEAVNSYLEAHPEATTTVQDGAITYEKLSTGLKEKCDDVDDLKTDLSESVGDLKSALQMESGGEWAGSTPAITNYSYASVGTLDGYKLTLSQGDVVSGSSARVGCTVLYNSEDFVGKKLILKPHFTINGESSAFTIEVTKQTNNDGVYTTLVPSLTDPEIELDFTNATFDGLRYNYMYFFLQGRGVTLAEDTVVEYIGYEIYDTTGSSHSERLDKMESDIERLDNWITNGLTVNLIQTIESNTYYRYSDGAKMVGSNYLSSTGLIPVTEGKTYTMNTLAGTQPHWTCWDAAGTFVTGSQSSGYSYTIPTGQNIKFLRASFLMANEATVMIVEGADVDYNSYYPYGFPARYAKSEWYGKKAAMFGDSLTKMGYWEQMFADILGLSGYEILGQSGGNMTAIANYVQNIPTDTDLLTVWAGTNDFANGITLGEFGSTNANEYAGALQHVIQYCGEHYPLMKILLITPMQRFDSVVSSWSKDASGAYINPDTNKTLEDYANMVKTYGNNYAIPVLDMYHESGFNQYNASAYSSDLLHPNRPGFQRLCWRIIEAAKAI